MAKLRVWIFLSTVIIVGLFGTFAVYYARGYRFSLKSMSFAPNGILVLKSEPDGASIYINNDLKGATNTNINLAPGTYDIEIKKDGFLTWYKRMVIEKEIVTQATVSLFKNTPSLSPVTFYGASGPIQSDDNSKVAFIVPQNKDAESGDKAGLYTIDVLSLPLGFARDPKQITDGDLTNAQFLFSPDARQILLQTGSGVFLLDTSTFTPQNERVNITSKKDLILAEWKQERKTQLDSLTQNLPPETSYIFKNNVSYIVFSPDENMILYTVSKDSKLLEKLIPQLPGSSTQKQERDIKVGKTYIYDIKEDRNFLITSEPLNGNLHWMPTSKHLLMSEENKVTIMDYDGTNRLKVYEGSYIAPYALPYTNSTKILILTNLGGQNVTPNLYSLTIK